MNKSTVAQCATAVSLFRGLYARVAHDLGVDVSYVSRIARGKRKSRVGEKALSAEFKRVAAVMSNGLARSRRKPYVVVTLQCSRCRTLQKVHVVARAGFVQSVGERVPCINCNNRFKVTIPNRIIRGPFPA
jgi:hypothetical protein